MKKAILLAAGLAIMQLQAQENMIYYELFGSGGLSSINYEVELSQKIPLTGRIGVGYMSDIIFTDETSITFPVSLHYLFHLDNRHSLELGAGYTFTSYDAEFTSTAMNFPVLLNAGYRYHFADTWMTRLALFPYLAEETAITADAQGGSVSDTRKPLKVWFGLSIGYRF